MAFSDPLVALPLQKGMIAVEVGRSIQKTSNNLIGLHFKPIFTAMSKQPEPNPLAGVIIVDKPKGPSSMGVVSVVRRRAGKAKTGHAGTLDPLATGVLVVCIGRPATRLVPRLMGTSKRYLATIDFSNTSETDDAEGPLHLVDWTRQTPVPQSEIENVLQTEYVGEIMQTPPAFSAMKIGGQRAYKLARQGKKVEMKSRPIQIYEIKIVSYEWPTLVLDIHCGKGTYIRSLARDVGQSLGGGGYLSALQRTAVGDFTIQQSTPLDDVPDPVEQHHLISVDEILQTVPEPSEP